MLIRTCFHQEKALVDRHLLKKVYHSIEVKIEDY